MNNLKRPRQYAAEIMTIKGREERREALNKVPEDIRDWVKKLVVNAYEIRAARRNSSQVRRG